jgi:hypothetical protein
MKERVKVVVLMPVGALSSRNRLDHIIDSIESICHYTTPDRRIVIQDNSSPMHLGEKLSDRFPEVAVIRAPDNYGLRGGLYKSESLAMLHIHATYDFDIMIKFDTDALMLDYGLEDEAIAYFERHPEVGLLGHHLVEGEGIAWGRKRIATETSTFGWVRDRHRCNRLSLYLQMALANGYRVGEHALGGSYIMSRKLVDRLVQGDFLLREEIRRCVIGEDQLFGLLTKAAGMEIANFQIPEHPMAIVWRGLPCSPAELVEQGAKIAHSTRFWQDMKEDDIRAFFRTRREQEKRVMQA